MQREIGHLILGDPAQLRALPVGESIEQFGGIGDDGGVRPVAAGRPRNLSVTTVVRTVSDSAGSPASSWASRTAACSGVLVAVAGTARQTPGAALVTPRRPMLQQDRGCEPSGPGARSSSPAAPCLPQ